MTTGFATRGRVHHRLAASSLPPAADDSGTCAAGGTKTSVGGAFPRRAPRYHGDPPMQMLVLALGLGVVVLFATVLLLWTGR